MRSQHAANSALQELTKTLAYAAGAIGYVLLLIAAYLLAVRPDRRLLTATLWPDDPDRRMLVLLLATPLVLPMLTAPIVGVMLTPLWTMSAWFLLPIILLARARDRRDAYRHDACRACRGDLYRGGLRRRAACRLAELRRRSQGWARLLPRRRR